MSIQSLQQLVSQYYGNHICQKSYQNNVVDFIKVNYFLTINKYLTYTSQRKAGNSQTKVAKE